MRVEERVARFRHIQLSPGIYPSVGVLCLKDSYGSIYII